MVKNPKVFREEINDLKIQKFLGLSPELGAIDTCLHLPPMHCTGAAERELSSLESASSRWRRPRRFRAYVDAGGTDGTFDTLTDSLKQQFRRVTAM
jgi:hypothetical protein